MAFDARAFLTEQFDFSDKTFGPGQRSEGVLAHIASDGPESWCITTPSREDVLDSLVKNIERWDLSIDRNINYRSMEPIFRLVRCFHQPQCQHWAVWALANLTKVSMQPETTTMVGWLGARRRRSIVT